MTNKTHLNHLNHEQTVCGLPIPWDDDRIVNFGEETCLKCREIAENEIKNG